MRCNVTKKSFLYAFKRSIPIMVGFFPVGIAYGIMMNQNGCNAVQTAAASLFVYAGSLQMLAVSFIKSGLPLATVAATALLMNCRHLFYGISFTEKFRTYGGLKYFLIYGMSDESYSLLCSYEPHDGVDERTVHLLSTAFIWIYWIIFSVAGEAIGGMLPFDTEGIDFALTALFVVILIDGVKKAESKIPFAVAACSACVCLPAFGADGFLLPSLAITCAALILMKGRVERER